MYFSIRLKSVGSHLNLATEIINIDNFLIRKSLAA